MVNQIEFYYNVKIKQDLSNYIPDITPANLILDKGTVSTDKSKLKKGLSENEINAIINRSDLDFINILD